MMQFRSMQMWLFILLVHALVLLTSGCSRDPDTDTDTDTGTGTDTDIDTGSQSSTNPVEVIVYAAASTTDILREAGQRFERATPNTRIRFSFAASSTLAQQIRAGAPVDIFISASSEWMDAVENAGELVAGSRINLLGNQLVLIAPASHPVEIDMTPDFDFPARLPTVKRIALGDPAHVPAGRYAQAALQSLGWWDAVEPLVIPAGDVRAALRLVEIGEVDLGIVYSTDATQSDRVVIIGAFPQDTHDPIVYPAALSVGASSIAEAFLAFLRSEEISEICAEAGFLVLSD